MSLKPLIAGLSQSSSSGGSPSGAAGGDLAGTYPNPTVAATRFDSPGAIGGTTPAAITATGFTGSGSTSALNLSSGLTAIGNFGSGSILSNGSLTIQTGAGQPMVMNGRGGLQLASDGALYFSNSGSQTTAGVAVQFRRKYTDASNHSEFNIDVTGSTATLSVSGAGTGASTLTGIAINSGSAPITKILTATATLDFASTAAGASADLTITLTGAAVGDCVLLGVPNGSTVSNSSFSAWVSATNTVTVRFIDNALVGTADPASGTFRVSVIQF